MDIEPQTVLAVAAVGALAYTCLNKKEEPKPVIPIVGGGKKTKKKSVKKSKKKSVKKSKKKSKKKSVKKSKKKSVKKSKKKSVKKSKKKSVKKSKKKSVKKSKKRLRREPLKVKANSKLGCVDLCKNGTASQQKKYCNRNSPPYPGAVCAELGFNKKKRKWW